MKAFVCAVMLILVAGGAFMAGRQFGSDVADLPEPIAGVSTPYGLDVKGLPEDAQEGNVVPETEPTPELVLDHAPAAYLNLKREAYGADPVWFAGYHDSEVYEGWARYAPLRYCTDCPSVFTRRFMAVPLRYEGARGYLIDFGPRAAPTPWNIADAISREEVPTESWKHSRTYYLAGVVMPDDDRCAAEAFAWIHRRLNDFPFPEHQTYYSEDKDYNPSPIHESLIRLKILSGPRPAYPITLWDEFGASLNELLIASGYGYAARYESGIPGEYAEAQRYAQEQRMGCLWSEG